MVKPSTNPALKIAHHLGGLAPLLSKIMGTNTEKPLPVSLNWNAETGPITQTIAELRKHDQTAPFYMMNLNKYYAHARYLEPEDIAGEKAYAR